MGNKYTIVLNKHYKLTDLLIDKGITVNSKLECPTCYEIPFTPYYQCKEGHLSCKECWVEIIKKTSKCPQCQISIKSIETDLSRNRYVEEEIGELQVLCPYLFSNILEINENKEFTIDELNGCKKIMKASELEAHIKNCEYRFIACTNNKECTSVLRNNKLKYHLENECEFVSIECKYCLNQFNKGVIESHYKECQSYLVTCKDCKQDSIKRSDIQFHIDSICPSATLDCKYKLQGCTVQFKRNEEEAHLNSINHTVYMSKFILQLEKKQQESDEKYDLVLKQLQMLAEQIKQNNKLIKESKML